MFTFYTLLFVYFVSFVCVVIARRTAIFHGIRVSVVYYYKNEALPVCLCMHFQFTCFCKILQIMVSEGLSLPVNKLKLLSIQFAET